MRKRWILLLVLFVLAVAMSPFCFCLVLMERFFEMANPKERPSQIVKDWLQGKR